MYREQPEYAIRNRRLAEQMAVSPAHTTTGPGIIMHHGLKIMILTEQQALKLANRIVDAIEKHKQEETQ